jgi:hypothetical protein
MATGTLYRPAARDAHGDPVDEQGHVTRVGSDGTEVGQIHGLVLGGPSWHPVNTRGDVVDTTGLVGVLAAEPIQPQHGDTLVVDGITYKIHGRPQWATRGLVSTPPQYRWWTITAASN